MFIIITICLEIVLMISLIRDIAYRSCLYLAVAPTDSLNIYRHSDHVFCHFYNAVDSGTGFGSICGFTREPVLASNGNGRIAFSPGLDIGNSFIHSSVPGWVLYSKPQPKGCKQVFFCRRSLYFSSHQLFF